MLNTKYKPDKLPEYLEFPVTILYNISGYKAGELTAWSWDSNGDKDSIVIIKTKCTVALDNDKDIAKLAIDSLSEAIKDAQAEAFKKISELEATREKFLQLTYQPEEVLEPGHSGINWEEPVSGDITDDEIPF